jgi:hypothetical protein
MEKTYKVVLHPLPGTTGGTLMESVTAKDRANAEKIAKAMYGSRYKVSVQG